MERCDVQECEQDTYNSDYSNNFRYYSSARAPALPTPQQQRGSDGCLYSEWSDWSPCTKTCGHHAMKIRARTVLNYQNSNHCNDRIEEKGCEVPPCLQGYRNYRNHNPYN